MNITEGNSAPIATSGDEWDFAFGRSPNGRLRRLDKAGVVDGLTFKGEAAGSVSRPLKDKVGDLHDVRDFGVTMDGVTDDTAAMQRALDAGVDLSMPVGTLRTTQPLIIRKSSVRLVGKGLDVGTGTQILCTHNGDAFQLQSVYRIILERFRVAHTSFSAGAGVSLNDAHRSKFNNLWIEGFARGVSAVNSRINDVAAVTIYARKPGSACLHIKGDAAGGGGGIWNITNCKWSGGDTAAPDGEGHEADGLILEGGVHTVVISSLQVIRCRFQLWTLPGVTAASGDNVRYLFAEDFEADSTGVHGIRLEAGAEMRFSKAWVQSAGGAGLYIGSAVDHVVFEGRIQGGDGAGVYVGGKRVLLNNCVIARNSFNNSAVYDGIEIASTASMVGVTNSVIGTSINGTGGQRYGVSIAAGASYVSLVGLILEGNVTGRILNQASVGEVQIRACRNVPDNTRRIVADAMSQVELGNALGTAAVVGNTTGSPLVNYLQLAGGAAGVSPSIRPAGADADQDLVLVARGEGLVRFGTPTTAAGAAATHVIRIKSASGTVYELLARQVT